MHFFCSEGFNGKFRIPFVEGLHDVGLRITGVVYELWFALPGAACYAANDVLDRVSRVHEDQEPSTVRRQIGFEPEHAEVGVNELWYDDATLSPEGDYAMLWG